MKFKTKLLTIVPAGLLLFTQIAASEEGQGRHKFGGAWVGRASLGNTVLGSWTAVHVPLNSQGSNAAVRLTLTSYGADLAALAGTFGADSWSDFVGHQEMISRDTARCRSVGYAHATGPFNAPQIRAIAIVTCTLRFIDADHAVWQTTLTVYPAAADADGDGLPDVGANPVVTLPNIIETGRRVPMQ